MQTLPEETQRIMWKLAKRLRAMIVEETLEEIMPSTVLAAAIRCELGKFNLFEGNASYVVSFMKRSLFYQAGEYRYLIEETRRRP